MNRILLCAVVATALISGVSSARAETFTYHGTLQDAGNAAEGSYDLRLTLYGAAQGGAALAVPVQLFGVAVHEGSFSTTADFGDLTSLGTQAWLEVAVKPAGGGDFATLASRAPVSPDVNSCPGAWSLDGNSGNPVGSYIGTADASDVIIQAGGAVGGHFIASSHAVGIAAGIVGSDSGTSSTAVSFANEAYGDYSFAGGYTGGTTYNGSFVWGDDPTPVHTITDSAANQFIVQANGGVGINTAHAEGTAPLNSTLTIGLPSGTTGTGLASIKLKSVDGDASSVTLGGLRNLLGTPYPVFAVTSRNSDGTNFTNATFGHQRINLNNAVASNGALTVGSDTTNGNGAYLTFGGVWTSTSSRAFKESFSSVNVEAVLSKLIAMPVQTWFYKQSHAEGLHMGPVAEDFAASFGLGSDDKHVGSVDESGVAFAAIQGLNQKVESENAQLKQENAQLRGKFDDLATRLAKLETGKGE